MGIVNVSVDYAVNTMKFGHLEDTNTVIVNDSIFQDSIIGLSDILSLSLLIR